MSKRVLIDTFNIGLPQPTGIATYARVLTHAHHCLGNDVYLLTDAPIPHAGDPAPGADRPSSVPLSRADPVLLFDHFRQSPRPPVAAHQGPVPWYIRNRLVSLRRLARRFGMVVEATPIQCVTQLDRVDQQAVRERLGSFDGIMNGPQLFMRALSRFRQTRRPTEIDLPVGVDIAHFTWCLPVRVRNAAKNIYTIHDLIPLRFPYFTLDDKSSYFDLIQWCCRTADLIITVSEHSRREIIDLMGVPPERVVNTFQSLEPASEQPRGATEDIPSLLRSIFGLSYAEYFLLAGAVTPHKNVARAIEAHLSASTGFPLVVCGPKNLLSDAELKLLDNPQLRQHWGSAGRSVIVLDYLPRRLVQLLVAGARAVLVPSLAEGFGLSALEAMAAGTPVIAAKAGALPEVCGPAAIYVDPYEVGEIRDAMRKAATLTAAELADLRSRSLAQAERFSFQAYCARLRELEAALLG